MKILTLKEAAKALKLSTRTVLDLLRSGKLPGRKIGGQWRLSELAIHQFLGAKPTTQEAKGVNKMIQNHESQSIPELVRSVCEQIEADGTVITRQEILTELRKIRPRINPTSILPADYCSNTKTGQWSKHSFLRSVGRGKYHLAVETTKPSLDASPPPEETPRSSSEGEEVEILADFCRRNFDLERAFLGDEYFYQSLPLCVIDAVFSLGIRYEAVQNVIQRYCDHSHIRKCREDKTAIPPEHEQESISDFYEKMEQEGIETFVEEIFNNRCRTSTSNGILKAEATYKFACVLRNWKVDFFQDIPDVVSNPDFEEQVRRIPGQGSGKSLRYFLMLAGSDNLIKPDRMILRFLRKVLDRSVDPEEAQMLLTEASEALSADYPNITPRLLDHIIWNHER